MLFFPTVDEDVQYFRSQGYTGSINDMHFKAMGDLGYTGSLSDRIHSFLVSEYGSFYESMRDLRNTTASFVALRYGVDAIQPELVLDFGEEYYRVDGGKTTLTSAVTHSRASNATMTDSDGVLKWAPHNSCPHSSDLNSFSTKVGVTVTSAAAVTPTGNSADKLVESGLNEDHRAHDASSRLAGRTRTVVTAKAGERGWLYLSFTNNTSSPYAFFNLSSGVVGTTGGGTINSATITSLGDGWYSCSLDATVSAAGLFVIGVSNADSAFSHLGDGTSGLFVSEVRSFKNDLGGMVNNPERGDSYVPTTTAAVYMPRVGHHIYDGYEWVNEGILHESAAATNLLLNSGTLSTQSATVAAAPNTLSFTGTGTVTLTGVSTAGPLVGTGTGENNRVNLTFTPTAGTLTLTVSGTVTNAQLEAGSTPSSYIPTTTATVTRAAETLTVPAANMPDYMTPTYIGGEEVTNGTFTGTGNVVNWTLDGTAVNNNGVDVFDVTAGAATNVVATQVIALTIGNTYQLSFERVTGTGSCSVSAASAGLPTLYSATIGVETRTFVATATSALLLINSGSGGLVAILDNISVKEINPLSVSIQMQGKMNYADGGSYTDGVFFRLLIDGADLIACRASGNSTDSGRVYFVQKDAGVQDVVFSSNEVIAEGVFSPFNLSSRHGSTFINGAVDGTALTANTTPTGIADLSATDFQIGTTFNGTISKLRVWGEDISDTGIATASAPTFTDEFAMTVTTTTANETFTIPCQNVGTFNAGIQWGDGSVSTVTAYNAAKLTHTFATAGDHLIRIRGSFPNIYFNNAGDKLKVKSVDNFGIVGWTRLNNAFFGCSNMTSFTAGTTDTSAVREMVSMFHGCSSLTALDLSSFNTAAVANMSYMFFGCSSLTALDVSNFNTATVVGMEGVFRDCSSLTSLDVSNFNTAAVVNTSGMFRECSGLTALDLSSFNTAAVRTMAFMFYDCSSLTSLDVSNFNTTAVTTMTNMFRLCTNLTALDVSSFNTTAVTNMSEMFKGCSGLTALDVSNFNTAAVTNMASVFYDCSSLTDIIGVEDFNIEGLNSTSDLNNFMTLVTLPTARYDALLINWDAQEAFDALTPHFGNSTYTGGGTAAAARANLISNDLWVITDGGIV